MAPDVARAIWIETPRSLVANTPSPTAQAVAAPGGYRVTGRQGFSTGRQNEILRFRLSVSEPRLARLSRDMQIILHRS
jgi:hypothetical protein